MVPKTTAGTNRGGERQAATAGRQQSTPPRVLHVEDDDDFSSALKYRLEAHGVAVVRAFDGADGLRQSRLQEADVVLLDLELPMLSGEQVLAALKGHPKTATIPIIVLTARRDRELHRRLTELGAFACLTKPVDFTDLRDKLARHIDILPQPVPHIRMSTSRRIGVGRKPVSSE